MQISFLTKTPQTEQAQIREQVQKIFSGLPLDSKPAALDSRHGTKLDRKETLEFATKHFKEHYLTIFRKKIGGVLRKLKIKKPLPSNIDYWGLGAQLSIAHERHKPDARIAREVASGSLLWFDQHKFREDMFDLLASEIQSFNPESVFEMGCGFGRALNALNPRLPKVKTWFGLDLSFPALVAAEHNFKTQGLRGRFTLIESDFENTKLPDQSVDVVMSMNSLICGCFGGKNDQDRILAEILRVTRKGGVLLEQEADRYLYGIKKRHGNWSFKRAQKFLVQKGVKCKLIDLPVHSNPFAPFRILVFSK